MTVVYKRKTLDGHAKIVAETGDFAPSITISFEHHEFRAHYSPHGAAELGLMLIAASKAAGGSALLGDVSKGGAA